MSFEYGLPIAPSGYVCSAEVRNTLDFCDIVRDESECTILITDENFKFVLTHDTTTGFGNGLDATEYELNNVIFNQTLRRWESDTVNFVDIADIHYANNSTSPTDVSIFPYSATPSPAYIGIGPNVGPCTSADVEIGTISDLLGRTDKTGKWVIQNYSDADFVNFVLFFLLNNGTVQYVQYFTICSYTTEEQTAGFQNVTPLGFIYNNISGQLPSDFSSPFNISWGNLSVVQL